MTTIQNILFPVDFSPSCDAMAPFVKRAAAMLSAKVTLLYVLEPSASGFELLTRPLPEVEETAKALPAPNSNRTFPLSSPCMTSHDCWWWERRRLASPRSREIAVST